MTVEKLIEELNKYDKDLIVVLETEQFWDNIGSVIKKGSTLNLKVDDYQREE